MKIAVFVPNWIGDVVMATPALRAIREHFAGAEIVAVLRPYVADVLAGLSLVDRHLIHHPAGKSAVENRGLRFVRSLRREKFDLAVLFPNSFHSAGLAWLSGARRRVGIDRDGRGWLLTDRLPSRPKKTPHPVIEEYLRIAAYLGCVALDRRMELASLPSDEQQLARFWNAQPGELRRREFVTLNSGGAFGAAKDWPAESFAILARRIAETYGHAVLVLCGPSEREQARRIVQQAEHRNVVSLADAPLSIGLTKAAVKQSVLLVTTDSGPRHFAAPFDVPVITLFGPTHIAWSETYSPRAIHLQHQVDCGPCQQRTCPLGHHRCMKELSVDTVFDAVARQLERRNAAHSRVA
ncbi:MAG: lipopolysaccharide heptosyltransferase II [Planctomycetaceae bacterium]